MPEVSSAGAAPASRPRVLVTGVSTGIGRATAELLRDRGWEVFASVRNAGEAPEGTIEIVFDVTDAEGIRHAAARIDELDALVDNAGIAIAAPLEFLPPEELTRQLDVNVVGQLRVLQAFLPALRRSHGRVVLMGSIGGKSALPFMGAYAMSKFALEAMADVLRLELAPFQMHVSIVEPGTIATPIWTKPQPLADAVSARYRPHLEKFRALAAARAAKAAPPDRVAQAIEHALTARRPKPRYLVGRDAHIRAAIERLPDRLRDRVLTRALLGG